MSFVSMLDLQSSTCSTSCIQTLQTSMTIPEWVDWCRRLVDSELPGICSRTVCDCDSNAMSGSKCHLSCPIGSNGQVCSGQNGFCIPVDDTEEVLDTISQNEALMFGIPLWTKSRSDSATIEGKCECILEPVKLVMFRAQYSNGTRVVHGIPSRYMRWFVRCMRDYHLFTRYNTSFRLEDDTLVPSNMTSFDAHRIVYPERFYFQSFDEIRMETNAYLFEFDIYIHDERIQKNINNNNEYLGKWKLPKPSFDTFVAINTKTNLSMPKSITALASRAVNKATALNSINPTLKHCDTWEDVAFYESNSILERRITLCVL